MISTNLVNLMRFTSCDPWLKTGGGAIRSASAYFVPRSQVNAGQRGNCHLVKSTCRSLTFIPPEGK